MRLSLAMIVKNEARFLAHCLESVQGLVDEAVVVDTGSEDATPEIARSKGAQVSHFPWCGDFSAARNAALARCRGDWILVLDADEAIDRKDHAAIRKALERTGIHGWMLPIRNHLRSGAYAGAGGEAGGVEVLACVSAAGGEEHDLAGRGARGCLRWVCLR